MRGDIAEIRHRAIARAAFFIASALILAAPLAASAEIPSTPEAREAVLRGLHWQGEGKYSLTASKSSLALPADYEIVQGAGAIAFYEVINGVTAPSNLEAVVLDPKAGNIIVFKSVRDGYVKFDDWSDVDADGFLESMKEGTEEENKDRAKHNVTPLTIVGWRQKPALDPASKTVSWALDLRDNGEPLVNASLLIFSRYGYEQLTWAG